MVMILDCILISKMRLLECNFRLFFHFFQIPLDRNPGNHSQRVHRLGPADTTSGEHKGWNFGSPVRRPNRCTCCQHSRPSFGQSKKFVSVRVRLPDEIRRLPTGKSQKFSKTVDIIKFSRVQFCFESLIGKERISTPKSVGKSLLYWSL